MTAILFPTLLLALPWSTAQAADDAPKIGFTDKGLSFQQPEGDARLNLDLLFQPRFTLAMNSDTEASHEDRWDGTGLRVRRMLFLLNGNVNPLVAYKFRINVASTQTFTDGDGRERTVSKPTLDDAMIDLRPSSAFQVAVGRFKVPFSAQWLTSTTRLALPERSLANDGLIYGEADVDGIGPGRDVGALAHGSAANHRLEWQLGVFSGDGGLRWPPSDPGYLYAAHVSFAPLGSFGYDEIDLQRGGTRFALGLGVTHDDLPEFGPQGGYQGRASEDRIGAEARFAVQGLTMTTEAYIGLSREPEMSLTDASRSMGWYAQASYVPADLPLVPALRWSQVDPDPDGDEDGVMVGQGTLNWLLPEPEGYEGKEWGERHRLQLDYSFGRLQETDQLLFHQVVGGLMIAL